MRRSFIAVCRVEISTVTNQIAIILSSSVSHLNIYLVLKATDETTLITLIFLISSSEVDERTSW